jgi:hypothetical protein
VASFLRVATGMAARSNVPMPIPSTPTDIVSGGSGVGDGVALGVGIVVGLGVGVGGVVPEHAARSITTTPASDRAESRERCIVTILRAASWGQPQGQSVRDRIDIEGRSSSPTEALALAFLG